MISVDIGRMRFNYRVAGIALHEQHVLLQQAEGSDNWFLPGGRCEAGETSAEALAREMREECDEAVSVGRLVWVVENFFTFVGLGLCCLVASRPLVANHVGYALPGPYGLPYHLRYDGRLYENAQTCAGADWCRAGGPPTCTTIASLQLDGYWPLLPIGWLWKLFDGPTIRRYALLKAPVPHGMTTTVVYARTGPDCFIAYSLEGGP